MATSVLAKMAVQIEANTAEFKKKLDSSSNTLKSFASNLAGIGAAVSFGALAKEAGEFLLNVSKLAAEAEGVENAFNKLPGSTRLMIDLKDATKGTISELELMKRSVQFQNFGLNLEQLPKLLDFAARRAQQTGQSVDYLADSIVTGLGRKSVLILDNLGISASELGKEVEKVGDFTTAVGNIVDKELGKMGDVVDTNISKTDRLASSWENFKINIGEAANETGLLGGSLDFLSKRLDVLNSKNLTFFQKLGAVTITGAGIGDDVVDAALNLDRALETRKANAEQAKQNKLYAEAADAIAKFGDQIDLYVGKLKTYGDKQELITAIIDLLNKKRQEEAAAIENIANLTARLTVLQENQKLVTGDQLAQTNQEIKVLEAKIKALKELGIVSSTPPPPVVVDFTLGELQINESEIMESVRAKGEQINAAIKNAIGTIEAGVEIDPESTAKADEEIESFRGKGEELAVGLSGIISSGVSSLATSLGEAAAGVGNFGESILKAVVGFAKQLGEILIASGVAMLAAKLLLKNPATAIAAGVALVAVSAAASASMSKNQSKTFGGGGGSSLAASATRGGQSGYVGSPGYASLIPEGEWRIDGRDLLYVVEKNQSLDTRRKS